MVPQQQRRRRRRAVLSKNAERRVVVVRGAGGFGFTIAGQRPCVVSAVATGGPAERAGLRTGDALLAVDGANVSRSPHASVARTIAGADGPIALTVAPRESPPTDTEDTEPEERARTRRRYPPPRRRPQPAVLHHPDDLMPNTISMLSCCSYNVRHQRNSSKLKSRSACAKPSCAVGMPCSCGLFRHYRNATSYSQFRSRKRQKFCKKTSSRKTSSDTSPFISSP
ncbi:regulator of G-protein signaling loco-like [Pieris napi]|uniref:regulator of G-protein signaling loco-like n=1 Tax=Pieris napi TaxID=78633 RepID=UPI001FB977EA|nr:regulator of G-protein signaling loco-like [Pieris napi]